MTRRFHEQKFKLNRSQIARKLLLLTQLNFRFRYVVTCTE